MSLRMLTFTKEYLYLLFLHTIENVLIHITEMMQIND